MLTYTESNTSSLPITTPLPTAPSECLTRWLTSHPGHACPGEKEDAMRIRSQAQHKRKSGNAISLFFGLTALLTSAAFSGCGAEAPSETLAQESVAQAQQALRTDCCYSACYDGRTGYYNLGRIGEDCRFHAEAFCHANHWSFKDAKWDSCN